MAAAAQTGGEAQPAGAPLRAETLGQLRGGLSDHVQQSGHAYPQPLGG